MANEWGAAPRRKVNHGSPYRCKGGFSGGVTRGCPFGSLDYMGVSRSRILTHPRLLRGGRRFPPPYFSPSFSSSTPLASLLLVSPYGAVCFVPTLGPG